MDLVVRTCSTRFSSVDTRRLLFISCVNHECSYIALREAFNNPAPTTVLLLYTLTPLRYARQSKQLSVYRLQHVSTSQRNKSHFQVRRASYIYYIQRRHLGRFTAALPMMLHIIIKRILAAASYIT